MRISADPKSPDYSPDARNHHFLFNGTILHDCIFADEEAGTVQVLKRDAEGQPVRTGDAFEYETRSGQVKLIRMKF